MDNRKRNLLIVCTTLFTLCLGLCVIIGVISKNDRLDAIQAAALAELESKTGTYDERYIVLNDTTKEEAETLAELLGATLRITENGKFARLGLPDGVTIRDVYAARENREYIESMSADFSVSISEIEDAVSGSAEEEDTSRYPLPPEVSVTDTDFSSQTYLNYINMSDVWNSYTGTGITVAVIDTGIDTAHPEFTGRISEYSYNATEDKIVKDYTLEDGSYDWSLVEDEQGHGTAVTGVIAASMNSGNVVGIAPDVNIIVIKAECDEKGEFKRTSDLVFGLYYAIERDVNVVNMSFGGGDQNSFVAPAQLAYDSDIICVAAAGNDSTSALTYPAALENVIGVGALASDSWELADYSNYGENTDIVAPGTTYTTLKNGTYGTANGTSLASPTVTGAIALLMQTNPYMTFDDVTGILYESTYDIGDLGPDWYYGYGALDVTELLKGERGTVTFDMLTDELENTEQLFIRGHALQNIPEPERTYAVFDGWYYDDTFTEELDYYTDEFEGDITLYAHWVNEDDGVPYTYVTLEDDTIEIRSYTGKRRFITIPEKIDGKVVSSIGDFAFSGQTRLREIELPSGLNHIGLSAFDGCANLVTIEIPEGVTEIEASTFSDCVRLSTVAFLGNSQLKTIGDFAFKGCGRLEQIELPTKVSSINGSAFYGCTWLTKIDVQSGNSNFIDIDGVLLNNTKTTVVAYPASHGTTYELPDGVTTIGEYAFAYAELSTIDLADVTTVKKAAFSASSLDSIVIPDSVTTMEDSVFEFNSRLNSVTIGRGVSEIPGSTFKKCFSLTDITIPSNITSVGVSAFYGSALQTVTFEEGSQLAAIGGSAFAFCSLREIAIPSSVTVIGNSAFYCNITLVRVGITADSNLIMVEDYAFYGCPFTSIVLPSKLTTIGEMAFMQTGLANTVIIPESVTTIGRGAFASCSALTAVDVEDGNTVYHDVDGVVYTLDNKQLHIYPAGKEGADYVVNTDTVSVMHYSFTGARNLLTVTLPEGLEQIAERAFNQCYSLSYITIPDNVTQIGRYSFAECWNLSTITINNTSKLPRLSFAAFAYSGITSFTVPTNVSTMAQYVFEGCRNLTSITFAENSKLESISAYMFDGCDNLTNITFMPGSSLTSIQAHGLEGMSKLTSLDFTNTRLTNIDNFAFRFCESLNSVTVPEGVTNIGRYAFYGCESMAELSIPSTIEHIGSYAFLGTGDMELYLAADSIPAYADEDWDYDLKGYYLGVTDVVTDGDFKYAVTIGGNIAILEYTGTATTLDLTTLNYANIIIIGGSAFEESTVEEITLPSTLETIQAEAFAYSAIKNITIPASVEFIGREAFVNTPIETVTFAGTSSIKTIEQYAFESTDNLTTVTLPASLATMGTGVFSESGLTSVIFSDGINLTEIPQKAFANTKLTSVKIPDSVTLVNHNAFNNVQTLESVTFGTAADMRLMSNAFYHTGLKSLNIPANVTYIGEYCFVALPNLTEFTVDESNPNYKSENGLLLTKLGRKLIATPAGMTGSLTLPISIEEIGFGAFEETKLSHINFDPNANILTFGYRAFFRAENITEITIPASVVSIDYYAFAYCENLTTVTFAEGNKLKGIYEGAFCGDINLENITIPDSIVEISDFAFYGCSKITSLPIGDNTAVKGIYDYAFAYTGIAGEFTLPEQIIDVGDYAFLGTKLTNVTIPDTNAKQLIIGIGAFEECNQLEEITMPFIGAGYEDEELSWFGYIFGAGSYEANDTYVPDSLKKVTISEGITFVGIGGFAYCARLEEINVPHSVVALYNDAFINTTAKYELTNTITTYWVDWEGAKKKAYSWHFGRGIAGELVFDKDVVIDSTTTMFYDCENLRSVILPDGLTSLDTLMFGECQNLVNVTIPNSVTKIDYGAFMSCGNLKSIELPSSLTSIGEFAFCETLLTTISLPQSLINIEDRAFNGCTNLYEIYNYSSIELTLGSDANGEVAAHAQVIIDAFGNKTYREQTSVIEYIDTEDGFRFIKENDKYKLVAYIGNETSVTLPESIYGVAYEIFQFDGATTVILPEGMTEINDWAFSGSGVKNIVIPEGVTHIGQLAFRGCHNIKKIELPDTLTTIDYGAFMDCHNLAEIEIPSSVTFIGGAVFNCCYALSNIEIPEGITEIGSGTFSWCFALEEVVMPDSVTYIGDGAFMRCENLKSITIPNGVTSIETRAFAQCSALEKLVLPEGVEYIGEGAFMATTEVVVPDNNPNYQFIDGILYDVPVTTIIYVSSSVPENLILPKGLTEIPPYIFQNCDELKNVVIPEGVTVIQEDAFSGSSIESITLPESLITIGGSFVGCENLKSIVVPENVVYIGARAFYECYDLKDVVLPYSLEYLGDSAFYNCNSLTEITIPNGLTTIEDSTFFNCGISSIVIPDTITTISYGAFWSCAGLKELSLPESVTSIEDYAFAQCAALNSVTISKSVKSIGSNAFMYCDNLWEIHNNSSLDLSFGSEENGWVAYYAKTITDKNGNAIYRDGVSSFERIDTEDGFRFIKENGEYTLVAYIGSEESITLPSDIEGHAYDIYRFFGGKTIIVPEEITVIGDNAFEYNATVENVILHDGITSVGHSAFRYCTNLSDVTLPKALSHISSYMFQNCIRLTSYAVPNGIVYIGDGAFSGCMNLKSITLPDTVETIGMNAFSNCDIESITIPNSVTTLGSGAFSSCPKLEDVVLSEKLKLIDYNLFYGCTNLTHIEIPDSVTHVGGYVFLFSGISNDPANWDRGMLIVDGWLFDLKEDTKYIDNWESIKGVAYDIYYDCHALKNAIRNNEFDQMSNVETLIVTDLDNAKAYPTNTTTLKNIVVTENVNPGDLNNNPYIFHSVKGITIYVEGLESDYRWDNNFPGWNNGNRVIYGDKWSWVKFYDDAGNLILCEPRTTSQIVRPPVSLPGYDSAYEITGWDLDGDGIADSIPATTTTDITATALIKCRHRIVTDSAIAPTCTTPGLTEGSHCDACGEVFVKQETIAATDHSIVSHDAKSATCENIGWEAYETCARCDHSTYAEIPALGHDIVKHDVQSATCESIGWNAYETCARCDHSTYAELPALGHDIVKNDARTATCESIGWNVYETCTRCDHTTYTEIPALGHDIVKHDAQSATCETIGWDAYETCARCDHSTYAELPALGHDIVKHDAQSATCETIGWDAYETCTRCDHTTYVEIPALGHDIVKHDAKSATCETIGWDAYETCTRCDHTTYAELPALGHTEGDWIIDREATWTEEGLKHTECTTCGETLATESMPAVGVDSDIDPEVLAQLPTTSLKLYKDKEHKEQITNASGLYLNEKIYYVLESDEGYRVTEFKANVGYMDQECFILTDPNVTFEISNVLAGDFTGDGKVNLVDVTMMIQYCAGWSADETKWKIEEDLISGDYYCDGVVNLKDVVAIIRMLAKWGNIHGGVQTNHSAIAEIKHEKAETLLIANAKEETTSSVITASEELKAYTQDQIFGDETSGETLNTKYDETFFVANDLVVITANEPVEFVSFKRINGIVTAEFADVSGFAEYGTVQILVIPKGSIEVGSQVSICII